MQRTKMLPTHRLTRTYEEEEEETKPQIEGEGDSESTLDLPSKRVLNTTYREYKHMLNSTTAVTSTCCGVYCKKARVCKRLWNYPLIQVAVKVNLILAALFFVCYILSISLFVENHTMSYQYTDKNLATVKTDIPIKLDDNDDFGTDPLQAQDINASSEDRITPPPSLECKAPVVIRVRGGDGYEYLEYTHTASHKWIKNSDRTDIRPANVTVIFVSGVTDSDPQRVFRCDKCVNSVPEWIAHRYANQPVQTVAIRTWKSVNRTSSSDSLHFAVAGLAGEGIIDISNPSTNIVWVLQGTAGADIVRLFGQRFPPPPLIRATRHFIFIDTPFLGSRLANIDELLPFSPTFWSISKVLSLPTRDEYTGDMVAAEHKFLKEVANIPLSLVCLSGENPMQRFTATYSMGLLLFILHYFWSILIVLSGIFVTVFSPTGFILSCVVNRSWWKTLLFILAIAVVFSTPISSRVAAKVETISCGWINDDVVHPFWSYVQFLNRPVVDELSAKHLCTLRKHSKVASLPLDYYTMSRPTNPSADLMVTIRTAIEMNIKKNIVTPPLTEEQKRLDAIYHAMYYLSPPDMRMIPNGNPLLELPRP